MKRAVNALQNFGKSLYGPVLILPIVGLFIAFGNVLGNGNLAEYLPFLGHPLIQSVGQLIAKSAVSVLVNLALVFAVGIPIGLATRDKGYAALIGLVTFIVFINAMNVTLQLQGELAPAEQMKAAGQSMVLGVQVLEMGVFAGILTGALSGYLYNKYSGVQFNGDLLRSLLCRDCDAACLYAARRGHERTLAVRTAWNKRSGAGDQRVRSVWRGDLRFP